MGKIPSLDFQQKLVARADMPLLDKKILFTSPRHYAGNLARYLTERGTRPVWMPTIAIYPLDDYSALDDALRHRDKFSWVALTSIMGSQAYLNRLRVLGLENTGSNTRLAAFAPDAIPLREAGIKIDLVPEVNYPRVMIAGIEKLGPAGGRVLVPVPDVRGIEEPFVIPEFISGLEGIGMVPERVPAYRTEATGAGNAWAREMLLNGEIDVTVFTSSAEIFSLIKAMDGAAEAINDTVVAYMGGYTAKTGERAGIRVDILPEQYDMPGVIAAIEAYFRNR